MLRAGGIAGNGIKNEFLMLVKTQRLERRDISLGSYVQPLWAPAPRQAATATCPVKP